MRNLLLIFLVITFSQCTPLKRMGFEEISTKNITKENYKNLEGTYSNTPILYKTKFSGIPYPYADTLTLFSILSGEPNSSFKPDNPTDSVAIKLLSKNKILITLINEKEDIVNLTLRGRIKNGHFYSRTKGFVVPFIPILFGYRFERFRIGLIKNNNLSVDFRLNHWAFALIAGTTEKGSCSAIYEKE